MKLKPVNLPTPQDAHRKREFFDFRVFLIHEQPDAVLLAGSKQSGEGFKKTEPVDIENQILSA